MRMLGFWFAVLPPKARLAFLLVLAVLIIAIARA